MTTSPKVIFRGGIRRRLSNRLIRDLSHLTLFLYLELGNDLAYKSGYLNFSNGTDQEKDLKKASTGACQGEEGTHEKNVIRTNERRLSQD